MHLGVSQPREAGRWASGRIKGADVSGEAGSLDMGSHAAPLGPVPANRTDPGSGLQQIQGTLVGYLGNTF